MRHALLAALALSACVGANDDFEPVPTPAHDTHREIPFTGSVGDQGVAMTIRVPCGVSDREAMELVGHATPVLVGDMLSREYAPAFFERVLAIIEDDGEPTEAPDRFEHALGVCHYHVRGTEHGPRRGLSCWITR